MELNLGTGRNRSKGMISVIMAIFLMMFVMIFITAMSIFLLRDNTIIKEVEIKSNIHTMGNALDAAKLYMETSLEYSIYQACYDNLRNGLSSSSKYQGYAVWDSSFQPDEAAFEESLGNSIKTNLKLYRGTKAYAFLSDYYVGLPDYNDVVVSLYDSDPQWMFVTAFADSNLKIEKTQESGEYIMLEKESTLQNANEYRIDCYGIYLKGAEIHNQAKTAVSDIMKQAGLPAKVAKLDDAAKKTISDAISTAEDKIKSAIRSLSSTGKDYDVGVDILSVKINYVTLGVDTSGTSLSYTPEVYVKFEITNIKDGQQFPVFDGQNVVMSPMTLVFVGKYGASQ